MPTSGAFNTVASVPEGNDSRPPRGALAVVAVGLVATIAAALLGNPNLSGAAAQLEWVAFENVEDSRPVPVPGGGGTMELAEAGLRSTGTNVSGYTLFRSAATLKVDAGSPIGGARILCAMRAPGGTEVGQTPGSRASYPRSSEELAKQEVPEVVLVEFASHGTGLAVVDVEDMPETFATEKGIKLEWPTYKIGVERWQWFLPPGPPAEDLELPFYTVWRATKPPSVEIDCKLTTSAGTASVRAAGAMSRMPKPIDED
jgi:hypothetical protein